MIGLVLLAAVAGGYLVTLWFWPYAPCRTCAGDGRNLGSTRKRWGLCGRCGGSGKRRRIGARR